MGRAKHALMEAQQRGYSYPVQRKAICPKHFNEEAINRHIVHNGFSGTCDFCGIDSGEKKVLDLNDFLDYLYRCITRYYNHADNELPYETAEGGYQGSTYSFEELIKEILDIDTPSDTSVIDEIIYFFDDTLWCERGYFAPKEGDIQRFDWKEFKKVIKYNFRYFFQKRTKSQEGDYRTVDEVLTDIFDSIKENNLIKTISLGTEVYRARQHNCNKNPYSLKDLGPPPIECCKYSNRMSPSGIPMFYGALDYTTTKKEIINDRCMHQESQLTIGEFILKKELKVIDLTHLPILPSIFDEKNVDKRESITFLYYFVFDLSREIKKDGMEHIEYIPTQVVTEYFRVFGMEEGIKGLVYPSSLNPYGKCCVFFINNNQCNELFSLINVKKETLC